MPDERHPAARAVRAARAYAGMSRAQLAERVGVSAETIGRWERGQWQEDPPRAPMLEAIARTSGLLDFFAAISDEQEPDPARRFAAAARQEARRRNGRPEPAPSTHRGEGAGGGES